MNQAERRIFLIRSLLAEDGRFADMEVPRDGAEQKRLLRSLMNVRAPGCVDESFLAVQDAYLQAETEQKGITDYKQLKPIRKGIYLWRGDITTLRCDAIVNAANSGMTGCYAPCHGCIDNAIHTYAGVQLRQFCADLMKRQGHEEPTGTAKITPAYNLPCKYVLHTVGPIVDGLLTAKHEAQLASCYRACLSLAEEQGLKSIAFCCISTGEFRFPNLRAAQIAVKAVTDFQARGHELEVIFNVFKEIDERIYRGLLGADSEIEAGAGGV